MGSIAPRKRKDGTIGYTAQIVLKKDGAVVHREARTFDRRPAAATWLEKREKELRTPGGIERAKSKGHTLGTAIDKYVEQSIRAIGRTKAQVLRAVKGHSISDMPAGDIGSDDLVQFAQELAAGGRSPATVGNYMSHLSAVFAVAMPAWKIPLDRQAMRDAQTVLHRLGQTGKSVRRSRRPSLDELDRLLEHFVRARAYRPSMMPMAHILVFALFSTRREAEISRLMAADLDRAGSRVLVRDMKHPGDKQGNDQWVELPPEAMRMLDALPPSPDGRLLPYGADGITANFTRACRLLDIDNLHFHDLRHEGISRLFEMGKTIPQVAYVSGHRQWSSLQRYTHLRATGDKYDGWLWLDRLAPLPQLPRQPSS